MWNLPAPPGFLGLRSDRPLDLYLRHMPHWRQDGSTYFVTFRLRDSLPQAKLNELRALRSEWERRNVPPYSTAALEELAFETLRQVERALDQGMGSCVLRDPGSAKIVADALRHFDGERYELACFAIMPNHVHGIVRPHPPEHTLQAILQSWKRHSARRINAERGSMGALWQEESYDRIIRDEEHLWRTIQYIGKNPQKAGLSPDVCPLWIRPQWVKVGWRFAE